MFGGNFECDDVGVAPPALERIEMSVSTTHLTLTMSGSIIVESDMYWRNSGPPTSLTMVIPTNPHLAITGAVVRIGDNEPLVGMLESCSAAKKKYEETKAAGCAAGLVEQSAELGMTRLRVGAVPAGANLRFIIQAVAFPQISDGEVRFIVPTASSSNEYVMRGTSPSRAAAACGRGAVQFSPSTNVIVDGTYPRLRSGMVQFASKTLTLTVTDAGGSSREGPRGSSRVAGRFDSPLCGPAIHLLLKLDRSSSLTSPETLGGYVIKGSAAVVAVAFTPPAGEEGRAPFDPSRRVLMSLLMDRSGSMSERVTHDESGSALSRMQLCQKAVAAILGMITDVQRTSAEHLFVEVMTFDTDLEWIGSSSVSGSTHPPTTTTTTTASATKYLQRDGVGKIHGTRCAVDARDATQMALLIANTQSFEERGGTELNFALAQVALVPTTTLPPLYARHIVLVVTDGDVSAGITPPVTEERFAIGIGEANEARLVTIAPGRGCTTILRGTSESGVLNEADLEAAAVFVVESSIRKVAYPRLKFPGVDPAHIFSVRGAQQVPYLSVQLLPYVISIPQGTREQYAAIMARVTIVQGDNEFSVPIEDVDPVKDVGCAKNEAAAALCATAVTMILRDPDRPTSDTTKEMKEAIALYVGKVAFPGVTAFVMSGGDRVGRAEVHTEGVLSAGGVWGELPLDAQIDVLVGETSMPESRDRTGVFPGGGGGGSSYNYVAGGIFWERTTRGFGGGGGFDLGGGGSSAFGGGDVGKRATRGGIPHHLYDTSFGGGGCEARPVMRGIRTDSGLDLGGGGTTKMYNDPATPFAFGAISNTQLRIKLMSLINMLNALYIKTGSWQHSDKLRNLCKFFGMAYVVNHETNCAEPAGIMAFFTSNEIAGSMLNKFTEGSV